MKASYDAETGELVFRIPCSPERIAAAPMSGGGTGKNKLVYTTGAFLPIDTDGTNLPAGLKVQINLIAKP